MKAIICVGISGSGKTTYSTNLIKNDPSFIRINRDDLRKTLVGSLEGYYTSNALYFRESIINQLEIDIINSAINYKKNLVIDNTNLKETYLKEKLQHLKDFDVYFKLFPIKLDLAKNRVFLRDYENELIIDERIDYSDRKEVEYIEKQFELYDNVEEWLVRNFEDKILW